MRVCFRQTVQLFAFALASTQYLKDLHQDLEREHLTGTIDLIVWPVLENFPVPE